MSIPKNSQNYNLDVKRHSFAHLMAAAVGQMFPEAQFGVGPVIETGCYYDFVLPRTLIPEDLPLIEKKIKEMLKEPLVFKVQEMELPEAIALFEKLEQPLKVELLNDLATRGTTSMSEEEKADFTSPQPPLQEGQKNIPPAPLKGGEGSSRLYFALNSIGKRPFDFPVVSYNKDLKDRSQDLRNNQTHSEKVFWEIIRKHPELGKLTWNRQKPINSFIADFYCRELNLIVEIDGSSHDDKEGYDFERDNKLKEQSLEILRFRNEEIEDSAKKVVEDIYNWSLQDSPFYDPKVHKTNSPLSRGVGEDVKITVYRLENEKTGEDLFVDLCKGPHVESREGFNSLRGVGFKLDKFSGSYWRGDQERNIQMQRIYALVFESKDELTEFINNREEAKKRDHRVLGQQLKLFTISDLVGAGLPLLQPNGMKIRQNIENYLWQLHKNKGYQRVWTPHIAKIDLYETSGHAAKFGDELFKVKGKDDDFIMKPMNCPHHMQIFDDNQFSYRDMPVRYFEPATVYRDEKTGQLSGLTRVRSITQDDGHLFCRISQIKDEVSTVVSIIREFYDTLGMQPDWVSLSVRDPNTPEAYLGGGEVWNEAEKALEEAAKENNLPYRRVEGEAAFYGPKLDFMFKDALNREWQLSTIQADFNLPERFKLSFKNENGEDERPVVIHRAISGSLERFLGVMTEHFGGWFPFWLAPTQVKILTVNNEQEITNYVSKISDILNQIVINKPLQNNDLRFEIDDRNESLGKKIREATLMKIPVLLIVGPKDIEAGEVSVRTQEGEEKVKLEELKEFLKSLK